MLKIAKTDKGNFITQGLFFETCAPEDREAFCVFTLKDADHEGYISLKRLFLSYEDPTEYMFAIDVFGNYQHWLKITRAGWFKKYIDAWRDEIEIKIRSRAIKQIAVHATGDKGYMASRWLAEGSWKPKALGAKSNARKEHDAKINDGIDAAVAKDVERLRVINNG